MATLDRTQLSAVLAFAVLVSGMVTYHGHPLQCPPEARGEWFQNETHLFACVNGVWKYREKVTPRVEGDLATIDNAYFSYEVYPAHSSCFVNSKGNCTHVQTLILGKREAGTHQIDIGLEFERDVPVAISIGKACHRYRETLYFENLSDNYTRGRVWCEWIDVTPAFKKQMRKNGRMFLWAKNVSWTEGELRAIKIEYETPYYENGEWVGWLKRSDESIAEALSSGKYLRLHPWYAGYFGNPVTNLARGIWYVDASDDGMSWKFEAPCTGSIYGMYFSPAVMSGTPNYVICLEGDSGGEPDGACIGSTSTDWSPSGLSTNRFSYVELGSAGSITKGTTYHFTTRCKSGGTCDGSNKIGFNYDGDGQGVFNAYNLSSGVEVLGTNDAGATWIHSDANPLGVLNISCLDYGWALGFPVHYITSVDVMTSSAETHTQQFTVNQGTDVNVTTLGTVLSVYAGDPMSSCGVNITLYNGTDSNLRGCLLTSVTAGAAWEECSIDWFLLKAGWNYSLSINCPCCDAVDRIGAYYVAGDRLATYSWVPDSTFLGAGFNRNGDPDDDMSFRFTATNVTTTSLTTTTTISAEGKPWINILNREHGRFPSLGGM